VKKIQEKIITNIFNKSLERVENSKYLVISKINKKWFHDKIELV